MKNEKKKKGDKFEKEGKEINKKEQVTRGHNIVADGWAGASNPHPHPTYTECI